MAVAEKDNVFVFELPGYRMTVDYNYYVQVRFEEHGTDYTYIDPTGSLKIGDVVEVPTRYGYENIAMVSRLGRGAYEGKCSKVTARYIKEQL